MTAAAINRLFDLIMQDRPEITEAGTARPLEEATAGMPDGTAAELIGEVNRSFGLLRMSAIVDPEALHQRLSDEEPGVRHDVGYDRQKQNLSPYGDAQNFSDHWVAFGNFRLNRVSNEAPTLHAMCSLFAD